jgi:hypothetical protein
MRTRVLLTVVTLATPSICYAAGCDDYPYIQSINVEQVKGGIRIISTAAVSVSFDDIDAVKDARDEATLEAKSQISQFLSEGIRSEQSVNKAVAETKSMQGDSKATARKETIDRLKQLRSSSQALLRGVLPLGECYTKGKEFRMSVGIKPETISDAETLSNGMSYPDLTQSEAAPKLGGQSSGVDGYSNTEGLKKF